MTITSKDPGMILKCYEVIASSIGIAGCNLEVLDRLISEQSKNDTYFVYNDLGQLRFVLSPEYQNHGYKAIFGYEYRYDKRGNIVKKILPQCEYIQYWYDTADRLTFMQDANLRSKNKYRFMLYDRLGRLCVQGLCDNFDEGLLKSDKVPVVEYRQKCGGVLNTDYILREPSLISGISLESVSYYDDYSYLAGSYEDEFSEVTPSATNFRNINTNGLQTGSVSVASNGKISFSAKAYDAKGNVTEDVRTTATGYAERVKTTYTFIGNVERQELSVSKHSKDICNSNIFNEYNKFNDKISSAKVTVDSGTWAKTSTTNYEYDDLGRLKALIRPEKAGNVVYEYNLRGWLKSISSPTFTESLFYEDGSNGYGIPCYNGNISSQRWTNGNYANPRWYRFAYDGLNRLTDAEYSEDDNHDRALNRFNESILEYDGNGNINKLQRRGRKQNGVYGKIDNLTIHHNGNQLDYVEDDADRLYYAGAFDFEGDAKNESHYKYNSNGSLIEDTGRGITFIEYDDFNNPKRIQFSNGNVTKYVYSADGEKLRTIHYTATANINVVAGQTHELRIPDEVLNIDSIDYIGSLILKDGSPEMYLFSGGYFAFRDDAPGNITGWKELGDIYYYNNDHLGNVREVIASDGTLKQVNNYYPFGVPFSDDSVSMKNPNFQPYKYTGKELDLTHGINTYDHGARQNYSILGVWDRVDPMAEKYYNISPYAVCGNNPLIFSDYTGTVIDTTQISKEKKQEYQETISDLKSSSAAFAELYKELEKSNETVIIKYRSNLINNVEAYFDPESWTVFFNADKGNVSTTAFSEEFFHAFQQINISCYIGSINREFEAKIFNILVGLESGGIGDYAGMDDFQQKLKSNYYATGELIGLSEVNSKKFLQEYINSSNNWADYNRKINFGNSEYWKQTSSNPYSLQKIIRSLYETYMNCFRQRE